MAEPIYIYGAGGLGREVLALIRSTGKWDVVGFADDGVAAGTIVNGLEVIGGADALNALCDIQVVVAIGHPQTKYAIVKRISRTGVAFPIIVHPSAIILDKPTVTIGEGAIITAGCVLTTNINVGRHVLINLNTTVGHDTDIGDCSSIMPGVNIAGEVAIGEQVMIGSGANVMNRMTIGDGARVGMGAVVTKPVEAGMTVVGVPARPL